MLDDGLPTVTSTQQHELEVKVAAQYSEIARLAKRLAAGGGGGSDDDDDDSEASGGTEEAAEALEEELSLLREAHARYIGGGLGPLSAGFASLDASRPWIVYWVLHSLALLGAPLPSTVTAPEVVAFLAACRHPGGGYGGGPGQMAHLAPTYAAVCALLTLGGPAALDSIDRTGVQQARRPLSLPACPSLCAPPQPPP
jgi:protein farnesyltransferase subunit beta